MDIFPYLDHLDPLESMELVPLLHHHLLQNCHLLSAYMSQIYTFVHTNKHNPFRLFLTQIPCLRWRQKSEMFLSRNFK